MVRWQRRSRDGCAEAGSMPSLLLQRAKRFRADLALPLLFEQRALGLLHFDRRALVREPQVAVVAGGVKRALLDRGLDRATRLAIVPAGAKTAPRAPPGGA